MKSLENSPYEKYFLKFAKLQEIVRDPNLPSLAKVILMDLAFYHGQKGEIFPSQKTLASHCNREPRTIQRYLNLLKKEKLISWRRGVYGRSNNYRLNSDIFIVINKKNMSALKTTNLSHKCIKNKYIKINGGEVGIKKDNGGSKSLTNSSSPFIDLHKRESGSVLKMRGRCIAAIKEKVRRLK